MIIWSEPGDGPRSIQSTPTHSLPSEIESKFIQPLFSKRISGTDWGKVVAAFVDEARSGKDTNRPQLQEMLKAIEKSKVDTILVTELS